MTDVYVCITECVCLVCPLRRAVVIFTESHFRELQETSTTRITRGLLSCYSVLNGDKVLSPRMSLIYFDMVDNRTFAAA